MARAVKSKVRKGVKVAKASVKKAKAKLTEGKKAAKALAHKVSKPEKTTQPKASVSEESKKKLSEKLLATIEKRKAEQGKSPAFSKPRGRRGRRPKNMADYQPYSEEQQDDPYSYPNENENLEYDTGIRVGGQNNGASFRDDGSIVLDRVEDFDEELNFDW
ncbi:MAG: hypothetical protein ACKN9V_10380 [Pseudomonadota bacterium]